MKTLLVISTLLVGCASVPQQPHDPAVTTGTAIGKAEAYTAAARSDVKVATPHADASGKVSLTSADRNLQNALAQLTDANKTLDAERTEKNKLTSTVKERDGQINALKKSLAYRIGFWILATMWGIVGLLLAHVALGILGLCISGPVGNICAKLGVGINPLAWFQSARDNYYFKKLANK